MSGPQPAAMAPDLGGRWWRPFAQLDDVAVVYVDLTADESNENEARSWLDDRELHRWQRFRHETARRRYVLCRASLRSLLCDALDCRNGQLAFETGRHGKPFAVVNGKRPEISFNVSHSGAHGLIALARRCRVGVDVEERAARRNLDALIDATLGPGERALVAAARGRQRLDMFLDMWTLKEALSKAHGKGLSMGVSGIEIPSSLRQGARRGLFRFSGTPSVAWRLYKIGNHSFAAAVAHEAHEGYGQ